MIIAISNQKGGVGKTTSSISLAAELGLMQKKTLLVDLDPQGSATSGAGVNVSNLEKDLYDVFFGGANIKDIVVSTGVNNLDLVPGSRDLVSLEIEIGKADGRELILREQLQTVSADYDYIIIDCPPSSGLLTLNAMGAAQFVLIPLQAEYYALEGLSALIDTIEFVRESFNPNLVILGVFMTMFDARTNLSSMVEQEARQYFGDLTFETRIPRNIKLSESPSHGLPISLYDPLSAGAIAYHNLALELIDRCNVHINTAGAVVNDL